MTTTRARAFTSPRDRPNGAAADRIVLTMSGNLTPTRLQHLRRVLQAILTGPTPVSLTLDVTALTDFPTGLFGLLIHTSTALRPHQRLHLIGLDNAVTTALHRPRVG